MADDNATGRIKIITTPEGEPPEWVREAWLRVESLPCLPTLGYPDGPSQGVLTNRVLLRRIEFLVPHDKAIKLLAQVVPTAAAWWEKHGFPHPGEFFAFGENEARIISGVHLQSLVHVEDDKQGDPHR